MTKVRTLLFTALAVVLACGICGQQALAQEDLAGGAQISAIAIGHVPDGTPEPAASAGMFQGIVAMGPNPPATGDWPCFAGATACTGIVAGGLVIGVPEQIWSKTCSGCGQIYYTFQTTSATGTCNVTITVTQGSPAKTLFTLSSPIGTVAKGVIEAVNVTGVSFTGAVAGAATITTTTKIGTATIKGGAKIMLH